MNSKAFTVYDGKAKTFSSPFFMITTGMALRAFEDLVNDPATMPSRHPEDFVLYECGTFDDQTGLMEFINPLNLVATASEYKKKAPVQLLPNLGQIIKPSEETNEIGNVAQLRTDSAG